MIDANRATVDELVEQFIQRLRNNEHPSVSEYIERNPQLASEIAEVFPTVAAMERYKQANDDSRERIGRYGKFLNQPHQRIGDYELLHEIGQGGMGIVFEARQRSLGRHVALKVLSTDVVSFTKRLERFRREAKAAARLHHTNIVPVFAVGDHDGISYYVMQLIEGVGLDRVTEHLRQSADKLLSPPDSAAVAESSQRLDVGCFTRAAVEALQIERPLRENDPQQPTASEELLESTRPLAATARAHHADPEGNARITEPPRAGRPVGGELNGVPKLGHAYWREVANIGLQVAGALDYAHHHQVVHRDIKPSNLLFDQDGTVWITDFGLAKPVGGVGVTSTGAAVGTLRYMAPEQINGRAECRSDIYSLGITLIELLTLRPAFEETRHGRLIEAITKHGVSQPRKVNRAIPRDLETIALKAASLEPQRRYNTAGELAADLQRFLVDQPILARRISAAEKLWRWCRRNPAAALSSAMAGLFLVVIAVVATAGNIRTTRALAETEVERSRAEREHHRAETNLALAMRAFHDIMDNVSARGVPKLLASQLDDVPSSEVLLTSADAELLQELLKFFDQFARNNRANLTTDSAQAYRRIGDIHQSLGQYHLAVDAYRSALSKYHSLSRDSPQNNEYMLAQAQVLGSIGTAHGRSGELSEGRDAYASAIRILNQTPDSMSRLNDHRYELAQMYLACSSIRREMVRDSVPSSRNSSLKQATRGSGAGQEKSRNHRVSDRHRRIIESSLEYRDRAIHLLRQLVQEDAANPRYRLTLAQYYRNRVNARSSELSVDEAAESLRTSISILDDLVEEFPNEPSYQVELADALITRHSEMSDEALRDEYAARIQRAIVISRSLHEALPHVHQYRALLAFSIGRLAAKHGESNQPDKAATSLQRVIAHQDALVQRYPEVSMYQFALANSCLLLSKHWEDQNMLAESNELLDNAVRRFEPFLGNRPSSYTRRRTMSKLYSAYVDVLEGLGEDDRAQEIREKSKSLRRRSS